MRKLKNKNTYVIAKLKPLLISCYMDIFFFCFFFVPESDVPTCLNWQTMNGRLSPDSIVGSPMETDSSVTLLPLVDIKSKHPYITAVNKIGTKGEAFGVECYPSHYLVIYLQTLNKLKCQCINI